MTVPTWGASAAPEFNFLVQASRWPHDAEAVARIREAGLYLRDPDLLGALARRHHVCGLVARALGLCDHAAMQDLRHELGQEARALVEEQFRQLLQTRAAVEALKLQDIAVVVLKGVPAALALYGEAGVRNSVDIDLLVARQDVERAAQVLTSLAYQRSEPPHDASPQLLRAHARYGKDWGFDHYYSDTGIELHWRLFQNPRLLHRVGMGDRILREFAPGIVLPVLPQNITTLYTVAHGAEHGWSRLKWLADLATALRRDPLAADDLMTAAADHGIVHMTMAALQLSHEVYGTPLPSPQKAATAEAWRTRMLLETARVCLLDAQDSADATMTRKNLSHYLFSADPRHWMHELAYDMFHDADGNAFARIGRRASRILRLPATAPLAGA